MSEIKNKNISNIKKTVHDEIDKTSEGLSSVQYFGCHESPLKHVLYMGHESDNLHVCNDIKNITTLWNLKYK